MVAGPVGQDGVAVQLVFAREISGLEQELAPIPFPLTMGCTATKEIVHSNRTARVRRRYLFLVITGVFLAYLKKKHLNAIALLLKITLSYSVAIPFYFRAVPNFLLHSAGSSPLSLNKSFTALPKEWDQYLRDWHSKWMPRKQHTSNTLTLTCRRTTPIW